MTSLPVLAVDDSVFVIYTTQHILLPRSIASAQVAMKRLRDDLLSSFCRKSSKLDGNSASPLKINRVPLDFLVGPLIL